MSPRELGVVDVVLLSHNHHFDNLDRLGREMLSTAGRVITTMEGARDLGGNAVGLTAWEHLDLQTPDNRIVRVTSTPARHGPANGDRGPVTGFVLQCVDTAESSVYISGDTVWFDGIEQIIRRFPRIGAAVLFLGAARVPVVNSHLTFTAEEAVRFARHLPDATIVPVHYEGWKHFSESREQINRSFVDAGLVDRLLWLKAGDPFELDIG
jgi:L-ascorbate metabolism protein UlaG (beta-lactamase superfamily)